MLKNKKQKNIKGSLLLAGFLFIFLSYFDFNTDKSELNLIASNYNTIYTNVNAKELLDILDNKTGVVLIIDDKKDINEYINLLIDLKDNETIYVYNSSKDEIVLTYENNEIKVLQDSSKEYKKLLKSLGSYTNQYTIDYNDEKIETGYLKINTPTVLYINEGNILFSYNNIENREGEELSNIIKMGFNILRKGTIE